MADISIFGLGYVGCVGAGCLAQLGHHVHGVDHQQTKVDFINSGRATIIEEGIEALIAQQRAAGRLQATTDLAAAVAETSISFICVGTPPTPNGHLDLSAIFRVGEDIAQALRSKSSRHVIAIRSTVMPGTNERLTELVARISGREPGVDFAVVSNPEFLREGSSIVDFQHPPFTLLGSNCDWATDVLRDIYRSIAAPVVVAVPRVAELMKYVCNSYHALKITFANEVGNICRALEIDGREVMDIFCRDEKLNVSRAYLRPGFAYGGSCLPKDLKALQTMAHDHYLRCPVIQSIAFSNEQQKELVLDEIQRQGCHRIGIIGLSFKPGTDDLRESPIIDVVERLLGKGYDVRIYDRHVHVARLVGANREYILERIPLIARFMTDDLESVVAHAELVVVVNEEPALSHLLESAHDAKVVFDVGRMQFTRAAAVAVTEGSPADRDPAASLVHA